VVHSKYPFRLLLLPVTALSQRQHSVGVISL
jgi:hypothetical protein